MSLYVGGRLGIILLYPALRPLQGTCQVARKDRAGTLRSLLVPPLPPSRTRRNFPPSLKSSSPQHRCLELSMRSIRSLLVSSYRNASLVESHVGRGDRRRRRNLQGHKGHYQLSGLVNPFALRYPATANSPLPHRLESEPCCGLGDLLGYRRGLSFLHRAIWKILHHLRAMVLGVSILTGVTVTQVNLGPSPDQTLADLKELLRASAQWLSGPVTEHTLQQALFDNVRASLRLAWYLSRNMRSDHPNYHCLMQLRAELSQYLQLWCDQEHLKNLDPSLLR